MLSPAGWCFGLLRARPDCLAGGYRLGQELYGEALLNLAGIACGGKGGIDGKTAQDIEAVLRGDLIELALAKDLDLLAAIGTLDIAHVLDDTQHGHVHLLGHVDSLGDDHRHQVLWARDDHDAVDRQRLKDGEGHVTRARGHVDQQVVERTPGGLAPKLADGAGDNGSAPKYGVGLVLQYEIR